MESQQVSQRMLTDVLNMRQLHGGGCADARSLINEMLQQNSDIAAKAASFFENVFFDMIVTNMLIEFPPRRFHERFFAHHLQKSGCFM